MVKVISFFLFFVLAAFHSGAETTKYPKSLDVPNLVKMHLKDVNISTILEIIKEEAPSDYFPQNVQLAKLDTIQKGKSRFHILLSKLEWGNKRLTMRLIVLSDNWHYLGNYYLSEEPIKIEDGSVVFPFDVIDGNVISFFDLSPPRTVHLDGEIVDFDASINEIN